MTKIRIFLPFPSSVVEQLLEASADFRTFIERRLAHSDHVRRFPDGALEVEGEEAYVKMRDLLRADGTLEFGLEGRSGFRSLAPFVPKHLYGIQYLSDYQEKLQSEESFYNGLGYPVPTTPRESKLSELEVCVFFRNRLSDRVRHALAAFLAEWAYKVSVRGVFDDGPLLLASSGISFFGTRAHFLIDASRSGQDTINWLSLALFEFAAKFHTITQIGYAYDPKVIHELAPYSGAPKFVSFPEQMTGQEVGKKDLKSPESYIPNGAVVATHFRSDKFHVLVLPDDEWDRFVATIYFARSPRLAEREEIKALIQAWLLLGSYGGFGGRGTHSSREVTFNENTDSVVIQADMGDSHPEMSLAVLIQSLERFASGSTPVEAIVFGRPL